MKAWETGVVHICNPSTRDSGGRSSLGLARAMYYILSVCLKEKKLIIRKRALEWNEVLTMTPPSRAANLRADACHSCSVCPEADIQCLPLPASSEMELLSLWTWFDLDELGVWFSLVPSQQEAIGADRPGTLRSLPPWHRTGITGLTLYTDTGIQALVVMLGHQTLGHLPQAQH